MLKFKFNEDKSDERFEWYECPIDNWMVSIINSKEGKMFSVFVKKFIHEWWNRWYIELADHTSNNLKDAKQIAKKLYEIALQYNPPIKWSEQ